MRKVLETTLTELDVWGTPRTETVRWVPLEVTGYDPGLENIGVRTFAFDTVDDPPIQLHLSPATGRVTWQRQFATFTGDWTRVVEFQQVGREIDLEPGTFLIIGEESLTGAEVAARRHLLGLSKEEMADALGVNPRTFRAWESGRDSTPVGLRRDFAALIRAHTNLVEQMLASEEPVRIIRGGAQVDGWPAGWHVAAAARALVERPGLQVRWV